MRCPMTADRMGVLQTLHASPARPYTINSWSK
jgi:hypothetical protein